MLPANRYPVRLATADDAGALVRLADIDSQRPLTGRVLIGFIDGRPAAAVSLEDGRAIADPFRSTADLVVQLCVRSGAVSAYQRTPSLRERLLAALSPAVHASGKSVA